MGKVYNNLISMTSGFNYVAQQPLDDREVVQSYADLATLVSSNASYDGMRVYVVDDKKSYELVDGDWHVVATETYVEQKLDEALLNCIPIVLTQTEYNTLIGGGTIMLNGKELTYEENRIYMIKRL